MTNNNSKTSIIRQFLTKKFNPKYQPTIEDLFYKEFDFGCVELNVCIRIYIFSPPGT